MGSSPMGSLLFSGVFMLSHDCVTCGLTFYSLKTTLCLKHGRYATNLDALCLVSRTQFCTSRAWLAPNARGDYLFVYLYC